MNTGNAVPGNKKIESQLIACSALRIRRPYKPVMLRTLVRKRCVKFRNLSQRKWVDWALGRIFVYRAHRGKELMRFGEIYNGFTWFRFDRPIGANIPDAAKQWWLPGESELEEWKPASTKRKEETASRKDECKRKLLSSQGGSGQIGLLNRNFQFSPMRYLARYMFLRRICPICGGEMVPNCGIVLSILHVGARH